MKEQTFVNCANAIYFAKGERPKGREHQVKSENEKLAHKKHQKKIKERRNARKGIYANKIKYGRNRSVK